jgi:hypothetical protein
MEEIFTHIYETSTWGNNNNPEYNGSSGGGSELQNNINFIGYEYLKNEHHLKKINNDEPYYFDYIVEKKNIFVTKDTVIIQKNENNLQLIFL